MEKKIYQARKGGVLKETDAQVVGETIAKIKKVNGSLKTEMVVNEAKNKKSILHNYFEWNDTKSAQKFRMQQARNLIGSIVETIIVQEIPVQQKTWHSVPSKKTEDKESEGKVYVTIGEALEDEDYRQHLLNKIITTLENLTVTMKMFKERGGK